MIKFRVWDKEHKRMLNIETLALSFSPKGVLTSIYTYGPDFSNDPEIIGDDEPDLDSVILEQFTGLTDVNGKEIYEGDILRLSYEEPKTYIYKDEYDPNPKIIAPKKVTRTAQVTKDAGTFGVSIYKVVFMTLRDVDKGRQTVEVIGNVHANPELLEERDD